MKENYSKSDNNTEKQVFLSESEALSKEETPADFDISVEELTAKLAEKKKVDQKKSEEKVVLEVKEELKSFPIQIDEEKPKSFSIKIEENEHEEKTHFEESFVQEPPRQAHRQIFTPRKNFLQKNKWLLAFTLLLVFSYFWFHPAENNLVSSSTVELSGDNMIKETVKEIPQTPAVEKIDLREEKLRKLIVEGVKD